MARGELSANQIKEMVSLLTVLVRTKVMCPRRRRPAINARAVRYVHPILVVVAALPAGMALSQLPSA
jgi:hypothetical protein